MKTANNNHHYAFDANGKLVYIHDVVNREQKFFCPYCKHEMITKMGKVKDWHFAHKHNTDDCDYDNYLHTLAKIRICNWFNSSDKIPIYLERELYTKCKDYEECKLSKSFKESNCFRKTGDKKLQEYNLKKFYENAVLEKAFVKDKKKNM